MTEVQSNPVVVPPTSPGMLGGEADETPSKWPTVIGVISLIYAIAGLLCNTSLNLMNMFGNVWGAMFDVDVSVPAIIRLTAGFMLVSMLVLGILMLTASIGLVRRRRYAVRRLKIWSLLRIAMILIGVVLTVVTLPTALKYSREMQEGFATKFADPDHPAPTAEFDEATQSRITLVSLTVMSGMFAVYPVFLMFFLSRQTITREVERWP